MRSLASPQRLLWALLLFACTNDNMGGGGDSQDLGSPDLTVGENQVTLRVEKAGTGQGVVTSTPAGIDCGARCEAVFAKGTQVALRATPAAGSIFSGFSGACQGESCDVTLASASSVVAKFDPEPPKVALTVQKTGPGQGRIVSDPPGLDCGTTCTAQFYEGSKVRLRLLSDDTNYLVGFGGACSGYGPCEVQIKQPATVNASFHPRLCRVPNFCSDTPYPQGNTLYSVFGFAADNIFAIGTRGSVLRYNGTGWLTMPSGITADLFNLWGASDKELWATSDGSVYRYDGTKWAVTLMLDPDLATPAIFGFAANHVWTAGRRGRAYRWDGTRWNSYGTPTNATWFGLWGATTNDVWAVGTDGAIGRWNGSSWSLVASGTTQFLYSVWGSSATDIWAVGDNGTVRRWNGMSWQPVNIGATEQLTRVLGRSATDIWIVGTGPRAYHYDGTKWSAVPLTGSLTNLWFGAGSTTWGVGDGGAIAAFDGTNWTFPYEPPRETVLGAYGLAEDDIFAVGRQGLISRFDGYLWKKMPSGTNQELNAIWGLSAKDMWAGGAGGTILRYDGTSWKAVPGASPTMTVRGISGSGPTDVWIVGSEGILRWDGTSLKNVTLPLVARLSHVVSVGKNDVWAGEGLMVHVKDGDVTIRNTPGVVVGMWGTGPNDVYGGYEDGLVQRYDGTKWVLSHRVNLPAVARFFANSPTDVWALGDAGRHVRWDGSAAVEYNNGLGTTFGVVVGTGPQVTRLFGQAGQVFRFKK